MLETLTAIVFISAIVFVAMTGKRSEDEKTDTNTSTNTTDVKK
ncbi:hypothetical protein FERRO_16930 [Ferrovum sp. JA12]|jgi:hypothetical protein|nr:hypothetical protein [Ferrovum sp. JA12]KRH78700.1 hypothetical protein FERRO_16930 [Ferrovum sp. JA12]HQT80859.1 hypothetical protein [Ferrovaceae bacterium]HQU06599.1 hypothetical protein [Ferrovaceae bacterium]